MSRATRWLDRRLYPAYEGNWDDDLFRAEILRWLRPSDDVLDVGAGAGLVRQMNFRERARRVCGIDPDTRVLANPHLDEARVASGEAIPFADASFDLVFADNVLEHLEDPAAVFREIARVLRPGGKLLVKTPNRRHYMPLIASITPHGFHRLVNTWRGRSSDHTFPTRYRVNTPGKLRHYARRAGLTVHSTRLVEGRPEYLRMLAPTYVLGWAYECAVNRVPGLWRFRGLLIAVLEKPDRRPA